MCHGVVHTGIHMGMVVRDAVGLGAGRTADGSYRYCQYCNKIDPWNSDVDDVPGGGMKLGWWLVGGWLVIVW